MVSCPKKRARILQICGSVDNQQGLLFCKLDKEDKHAMYIQHELVSGDVLLLATAYPTSVKDPETGQMVVASPSERDSRKTELLLNSSQEFT